MTKFNGAALRGWVRKTLLLVAILAAPAAYSEVAPSDSPSDQPPAPCLATICRAAWRAATMTPKLPPTFTPRLWPRIPGNEIILEQAFLLEAASAHWDRALPLAKELVKIEPSHRIAQFLLGCDAFKRGDYTEADEHFAAARQGPIADLTSTLARAWVQQAAGKTDDAFATLDSLSDADWAQFYQRYHRALIADVAGRHDVAGQAFAQAFKKNPVDA